MQCIREFHSKGRVNKATPGRFTLLDFDHHRMVIHGLSFDGAAEPQLTGRKLAQDPSCTPNVRSVIRDRAHAVRTNLRSPLDSDTDMKRIRHQLLHKPMSLSKLIQYHPRARNAHGVCQSIVLNVDGEQGGGLKTVLKNFSFANQRFDLEAAPSRGIACTLTVSYTHLTLPTTPYV